MFITCRPLFCGREDTKPCFLTNTNRGAVCYATLSSFCISQKGEMRRKRRGRIGRGDTAGTARIVRSSKRTGGTVQKFLRIVYAICVLLIGYDMPNKFRIKTWSCSGSALALPHRCRWTINWIQGCAARDFLPDPRWLFLSAGLAASRKADPTPWAWKYQSLTDWTTRTTWAVGLCLCIFPF